MKMTQYFSILAAGGLSLFAIGCNETTRDDVTDARNEVAEQKAELEETKREEARAIREEENEAAAARTTNKVIVGDDVNEGAAEESQEAQRAKTAAQDRIREQEANVAEAEREAKATEAELKVDQARDMFAIESRKHIDLANTAIAKLEVKKDAADDEGDKPLDAQINALTAKRDTLEKEIDDVEGAETAKWQDHKQDVDKAIQALSEEVRKVS